MKHYTALLSALLISGCNSDASKPVAEKPETAPAAQTTAAETAAPVATAAENEPAPPKEDKPKTYSQTLRCNFNNEVDFKVALIDLVDKTNPRGGTETYGTYKVRGESPALDPSGSVTIRGGVYFFNDETDFAPTDDGKSIVYQSESGDVLPCIM
jgi:hypothetical protein